MDVAPDPHGLYARKASDFGVDSAFSEVLRSRVPELVRTSLLGLVDAWAQAGGLHQGQAQREALIHAVAASSPQAGAGMAMLQKIVLALCYAMPDAHGQNDANGESVSRYALNDALDLAHLARATRELSRLHEAAAAERILGAVGQDLHEYRRGDSFTAFGDRLADAPYGAAGRAVFSAHQMGSARMGQDPAHSVAQPSGELHDTRGVWIGDTSAFPPAPGVNPMITCMALAARTAAHIAAQS